jgi:hypothetical protein
MEREELKESRVLMRRVDDHLRLAHRMVGAVEETTGAIDVIYHENSRLPQLNYVTPRRNTAWVSGKYVMQGLELLRQKDRTIHVRFAEGLYPSIFVKSLTEIGLVAHHETPIMAYQAQQPAIESPQLPDGVSCVQTAGHDSMAVWWYVWRSGWYDTLINSLEPLLIEREVTNLNADNQLNIILYRNQYPIGISRLTVHAGGAHLMAQAFLREVRTPALEQLLRQVSVEFALKSGCDLIFACSDSARQRSDYHEMGFTDASRIIIYAQPDAALYKPNDGKLQQPVLVL